MPAVASLRWLMSSDIPRGSLNSTDDVSELIEELQDTLGEGPCADACQQAPLTRRSRAGTGRRKKGCRGPGSIWYPAGPDGPPGVQEVS